MKISFVLNTVWVVAISALLSFSTPAFGDNSRELVSQALDLVQQASGQGVGAPSNEQRQELLTQAMSLLGNETINFHGHVGKAMNAIRAALSKIKNGDPYGTAINNIHGASSELHKAMSMRT